jgi:hypothetical protein
MAGTVSISEIKNVLGTPEKPVSSKEMMDFWKVLTEDEKEQCREFASSQR